MVVYEGQAQKGQYPITQLKFRQAYTAGVTLRDAAKTLGISLDAARVLAVCCRMEKPARYAGAIKHIVKATDKGWHLYTGARARAILLAKAQGVQIFDDDESQKKGAPAAGAVSANRGGRSKRTAPSYMYEHAWLAEQYETKQRTVADIASEMGISTVQVWFYLRKHGIKLRPTAGGRMRGRSRAGSSSIPDQMRTREWLFEQYMVQCKPIDEICSLMGGCTRATFHRLLKQAGIEPGRMNTGASGSI